MNSKGDLVNRSVAKKAYSPPTLRPLRRDELTEEQRAWVDASFVRSKPRASTPPDLLPRLVVVAVLGALFLALSWFLSGCALSDAVYVDTRFTPAEQVEIQAAADYWCQATKGAACIDLVFDARVVLTDAGGRRVLVRVDETDAMRSRSEGLRSGKTGSRWLTYESGVRSEEVIAIVPSRVIDGWFRTVVAHELGHHFDMNHVGAPGALMQGIDGGGVANGNPEARAHVEAGCLSAADIAELCNSHECGHPKECAP